MYNRVLIKLDLKIRIRIKKIYTGIQIFLKS